MLIIEHEYEHVLVIHFRLKLLYMYYYEWKKKGLNWESKKLKYEYLKDLSLQTWDTTLYFTLHNHSQFYTLFCALRFEGIKTLQKYQKCKWKCRYGNMGSELGVILKNSKALFKCMAPPSHPFPFFPTAQENMIRVHWCVYNEEVTVSWERSCNSPYRGTGFFGELAEHSCSLMHALMCASDDPSKSKVLLRRCLHKTRTVGLYQYPLLSTQFF